jgi:D-3-phosphoglycerate dehydrogenase
MIMYKVIVTTDYADDQLMNLAKEMLKGKAEIELIACPKEEDLIEKCQDADATLSGYEPFTDKVFAALPKLKLVSILSIGYNFADVDAAKKYGVAVCNNPTYCVNEVADHTMALLLTLNRRLFNYNAAIKKEHVWSARMEKGNIKRMNTQTVGLVGFGNIARRVAARMQACGCKVIAYDPYVKQEFADQFNVQLVTLDEIYEQSDMISLHALLNKETEKLVNREAFEKMAAKKPYLVNCGRGGLIDEDALLEALQTGKLMGAGLDVFVSETPDLAASPFTKLGDNVILTPHAAFFSDDAAYEQKVLAVQHIIDFFEGRGDKVPVLNGIRSPKA